MYRMWSAGVSLVTWFTLRDEAYPASLFQSGLYFYSGPQYRLDRPKPALTAFRFPFVALADRGRVLVWGRTPGGARGTVIVERRTSRGWARAAVLRANGHGIFTSRLPRAASFRARAGGTSSLAFSVGRTPEYALETPFG
jgi:hypothetical protein